MDLAVKCTVGYADGRFALGNEERPGRGIRPWVPLFAGYGVKQGVNTRADPRRLIGPGGQ